MALPAPPEPDSPDVAPPLGGGRFRLQEVLGEGGTATVYRAWDDERGAACAVKVLSPAARGDPTLLERFAREGRLLSQLRHPGLVSVHEVGDDAGRPFFVMDLAESGSLRDRITDGGPVPVEEAVRLLLPVLDALERVHAAGVVHRDVKPDNVVLDAAGRPRLADFGVARLDAEATLTLDGERLGSFAYMAPEQFEGRGHVDARADVYGAAATLVALVAGRPPFGLREPERRDALLSGFPPSLRAVVEDATAADPARRTPSARALSQALLAASRAAPAPPPGLGPLGVLLGVGGLVTAVALALGGLARVVGVAPVPPATPPVASPAPPASAGTVSVTAPVLWPTPAIEAPGGAASPPARPTSPRVVAEPAPPVATLPDAPDTPPAPGTLLVNSVPWSEVLLDGKPRARTPWSGEVAAGEHVVHLTDRQGREREERLTVPPGGAVRYCWNFTVDAVCPP